MTFAANALWQQVTGTVPDEASRGLVIRFELVSVVDQPKSDAEGRTVANDVEFIEIRSPNDPMTVIHRPVEDSDKRLYPQAYKAWKEGASDAVTGTPLKEWAPMARSQVERCQMSGIRSVEQFANVSDDGCHHLGHGMRTLRDKAQAWLLQAKDASHVTKMTAELAKRDSEIQALRNQLADIAGRMDARDEAPVPKKPKHS